MYKNYFFEEVALHVRTGGSSGKCWRFGLGEPDQGRLLGDQLKKSAMQARIFEFCEIGAGVKF
jgi:hypothetical protein